MDKQVISQYKRLLFLIGSIIIVYFILKYTYLYVYPFLIAILFASLFHPFVKQLEALKIPRIVSSILIVSFLFLLIFSFVFYILSEFIQGSVYLAKIIPIHLQNFMNIIDLILHEKILPIYNQLISYIQTLDDSQQSTFYTYINQLLQQITSFSTRVINDFLLGIPAYLSILPQSVVIVIFIFIATILLTNEWPIFIVKVKQAIPNQFIVKYHHFIVHFKKIGFGFLKAQIILVLISAIIILTGLSFLKIEHALTITLLISFIDFLPLVGTGLVFLPWIAYQFLTANFPLTIGLSITYLIVVILRQLLEPKILSIHIGVSPVATLFILFISLQLWGIAGFFLAPFLLIFISTMYQAGMIRQLWHYIKDE